MNCWPLFLKKKKTIEIHYTLPEKQNRFKINNKFKFLILLINIFFNLQYRI